MMPGIDGLELCKKLKTDERTSHIPIIILTARHSFESQIESFETGADAYITKPFNANVLKIRIRNLIESRSKLRELFNHNPGFDTKVIAVNTADNTFLNKIVHLIETNLSDTMFDIEKLAELLNLSRTQLYRKIKSLTNQSVHDFVTTIRLNKAAEMLLAEKYSIAEIAFKVGYSESSNFSRSFLKLYGLTPKNYVKSMRKTNTIN
jgi:YesN/AraC family two-component response regulator